MTQRLNQINNKKDFLLSSRTPSTILVRICTLLLFSMSVAFIYVYSEKILSKISNPSLTQRWTNFKLFWEPGPAMYVLPEGIQRTLTFLNNNQATQYTMSPSWWADPLYRQRINESAWPMRETPRSQYFLSLKENEIPTYCQIKEKYELTNENRTVFLSTCF